MVWLQAVKSARDPADTRRVVGTVVDATAETIDRALRRATRAFPAWDQAGGEQRAVCLERLASLLEP